MNSLFRYGYSDFVHFWRQVAHIHRDIHDFAIGNSDRILSNQRDNCKYPMLWLEDPDITFDSICQQVWTTAFTILDSAPVDCSKTQDLVLNYSLHTVMDLLKRFEKYADECKFEFELPKVRIDRIFSLSHDNDYGWRVSLSFTIPVELCDRPCKFDNCPDCFMALFCWENKNEGDFKDFTIRNLTTPDDIDLDYKWTWQFDENTAATSTEETPEISGTGEHLYICLHVTDPETGCCVEASAYLCAHKNCNYSVPYKMKYVYDDSDKRIADSF